MSALLGEDRKYDASSICDILQERAGRSPDAPAYRFLASDPGRDYEVSYAQLDARARAVAAFLQSRQWLGRPVALIFPPGPDYVAALYGVLYAGAIAVPLNAPGSAAGAHRLSSVLADIGRCIVLTGQNLRATPHHDLLARATQAEFVSLEQIDNVALSWRRPDRVTEDSLAILQYTSGSTANPKGVEVRNRNLLHNLSVIARASGFDNGDNVGVSWLPHYHDMGLIGGIFVPMYVGFPVNLISPSQFAAQPMKWLHAISRYRATVSGAPHFAYDYLVERASKEALSQLDLSSWRIAYTGAEPIRAQTIDRFCEVFADCGFRRETFFPCYGLAEATLMVSGGPVAAPLKRRSISREGLSNGRAMDIGLQGAAVDVVSSGSLIDTQLVRIVDPKSLQVRGANEIGEIWVLSESVGAGYWGRPSETLQTFRAELSGQSGFLRTGDLGFVSDGHLFVTGRMKDLIIVRGRNHHPQDIEQTVEKSCSFLRVGCGAAFTAEVDREEELIVVYEYDRRSPKPTQAVFQSIAASVLKVHGLRVGAVALIRHGTISKTTSGKVQRQLTRSKFLDGSLIVIGMWQAGQTATTPVSEPEQPVRPSGLVGRVETFLVSELSTLLSVDAGRVDVGAPVLLLGLDSLTATQLSNRVAQQFGIRLDPSELLDDITISEIASTVARKASQAEGQEQTPAALLQSILRMGDEDISNILSGRGGGRPSDGISTDD